MPLRVKREDVFKREKVEDTEKIDPTLSQKDYDVDIFGDSFIFMPKMEDEREKNLEKNIKKEWLDRSDGH